MLKSLRRKILGDLRANRGQFFAVWLVITLGTAFYGAMYPAGVNMLHSIYRTYDDLHYLDFQVQFDATTPDRLEDARALPGVDRVEGRLIVDSGLKANPERDYLISLRLISVPDDRAPTVNQGHITSGRDIAGPGEIVALDRFARRHGIQPGDTLDVLVGGTLRRLTVAGTAFNPEYFVSGRSPEAPFPTPSTFGVAWMRYSELAAFTGQEGLINDIVIRMEGSASDDRDATRQALTGLFAQDDSAVIYGRAQTASGGVVSALINGNFPLMRFYSGMFLIGATVTTAILLARLVESERQRIGTMRSLGVTRRELALHYLSYGLIMGVSGGIAGSLLGYLNSFWVMGTFLSYIAGGPLPGFVNHPQWAFILLGFVIVVAGATLAGAIPAWTLSATPPGIALRPAMPKTPSSISRLRLRFLPLALRQPARNLLRAPGRSVGTALGMMAGAMMIFSSLAMWDTMNVRFGEFFDAHAYDLRVDMNVFLPGETLDAQVSAIDSVADAQAALIGPIAITRADGQQLDGIGIVVDEADPYFHLEPLAGAPPFSRPDGVWIGNNLRRALGVGVGDTITVRALGQAMEVEILGVVSYVIGNPVFVPRALFTADLPFFPANAALIRAQPGREDDARDAVIALPGVIAAESFAEFQADMERYLAYFRVGTIIFGGFGYILTLALLFNTVNASLRERREELAVLRALGTSARAIAIAVTVELMLMVALGAIIGVPLGREIGFWMFNSYRTEFYGTINLLSPAYTILGLASLIIVILLAEIPGLRAAQRADLGQVSKTQSF